MKKFLQLLLVLVMAVNFTGCAVVLVGAGVAGGLAIAEDTVKLTKDRSYNKCWSATLSEIQKMGKVDLKDKDAGKIEATVRDSKVWATVKILTPKTVTIEIKCRKNMFPNINLANEIANRIAKRL